MAPQAVSVRRQVSRRHKQSHLCGGVARRRIGTSRRSGSPDPTLRNDSGRGALVLGNVRNAFDENCTPGHPSDLARLDQLLCRHCGVRRPRFRERRSSGCRRNCPSGSSRALSADWVCQVRSADRAVCLAVAQRNTWNVPAWPARTGTHREQLGSSSNATTRAICRAGIDIGACLHRRGTLAASAVRGRLPTSLCMELSALRISSRAPV